MTYFTAVFKDLPADELIAIAQDERCRFMAHSHVGHERDELLATLKHLYETQVSSVSIEQYNLLHAELAASQHYAQQLREAIQHFANTGYFNTAELEAALSLPHPTTPRRWMRW